MHRFFLSVFVLGFVTLSGGVLLPQQAEAAAFGLVPCALQNDDQSTPGWDERDPCTLCHFLIGMQRIVHFLRNVMTAIAIAVIVAMAIVYITSAGDEGRMGFAKEGIKWSLVGFAIILLAWVAVNFIFTLPIFSSSGLVRTNGSWDNFTCNTKSRSASATGAPMASSIGNASGSSVYNGIGRAENPGITGVDPGSGGSGGDPGSGGSGGDGGNSGGSGTPAPRCGGVHYECDSGTASDMQELGDRWIWLCKIGSSQQFCLERVSGCGDGIVSGVNNNGDLETCDEGGRNVLCEWGSTGIVPVGCDINFCIPCGGVGTKPIPPGCGPSNGTSSAPAEPLCVGGATASTVKISDVGTNKRYDWTCSVAGLSGSFACASGYLSSGSGNPTATCGSAAGTSSSTVPVINLCDSGSVTNSGVRELISATTGEALWYWSCSLGTGSDGFVTTSCYAPNTSGSTNNCAGGSYSWTTDGFTCSANYAGIANGSTGKGCGVGYSTTGCVTLQCINGSVSQVEATCSPR